MITPKKETSKAKFRKKNALVHPYEEAKNVMGKPAIIADTENQVRFKYFKNKF